MESPAAPVAEPTQRPQQTESEPESTARKTMPKAAPAPANARFPATRHYRGMLRFPVIRQLIRFTGVGIVCTATSLALYALLRPLLGPQLANAAALIITSVMNTALNRRL